MGNEFTGADLAPHTVRYTMHYLLDWATATGVSTVIEGGYHGKMKLRKLTVVNVGAALNATEPIINVQHGGNEVVATVDMTNLLSATAVVGEAADATLLDAYTTLEAEDALQVEVETADGGADTRALLLFDYELIE